MPGTPWLNGLLLELGKSPVGALREKVPSAQHVQFLTTKKAYVALFGGRKAIIRISVWQEGSKSTSIEEVVNFGPGYAMAA
jgi:hypothetical protein